MTYENRTLVKRYAKKPSLDGYQNSEFMEDQKRFGGLQGATLALKYILGSMRILRNYGDYDFANVEDYFNQIECDQMELDVLRMRCESQAAKIQELTTQVYQLQGMACGNSISQTCN